MIVVHNFARGARGLRVLWLCEEIGLACRFEAVSYPPSPAYLALNPLGNVPFLQDGTVAINESVAMLLYLAQTYGPTPLLPGAGDPALAKVLQLTVMGETALGMRLNPLLGAKFAAPEADKRNWSVRGLEQGVAETVAYLSAELAGRDFIVGDGLTVADLCVATGLGIWRGALGGDLPENLSGYLARMAARPAYKRAQAMMAA
jgi:glutathione S-transferase